MTVAVLTARDAEGVLRFLAAAEEPGGDEPFTPRILEDLGALIAAERVTYCEQDRVRKRERLTVGRSNDEWPAEAAVSYWDIAGEHPVCSRHNRGSFGALKLSDFLSLKQLKRTHVYAVWFGPADVDYELNVAIPSPPWHTKTFLFDRGPGRDFTERDRLLLDLLQPHFGQLWRAAHDRRRLRAALAALELESEHQARGVIVLTPGGRAEVVSPAARRLLREYFRTPPETDNLPPALVDWLETGSRTVRREQDERRLTIDRCGNALVLEETHGDLGLTARERQILAWVARGETNAEVAETLWIAPSTVRKHLENVYAKLGVRTRTAAVTRFLAVLDGEDRQENPPA
jgi:DNA-binding CsgD family transcriptional regulator